MVDFLIDIADAEVDIIADENWTPLALAARRGHLEIIETLLENGAEINVLQDSGSALFWAAKNSELDTVVLLLEHDADPSICGKTWSPLHAACQNGDIEIAQILIGNYPCTVWKSKHFSDLNTTQILCHIISSNFDEFKA